jgi:Dual specificity protein phosphatase, N-terminal half
MSDIIICTVCPDASCSLLQDVLEVVPRSLFVLLASNPDATPALDNVIALSVDNALIYEPFCRDFGPVNLGRTYRLCQKIEALLQVRRSPHCITMFLVLFDCIVPF